MQKIAVFGRFRPVTDGFWPQRSDQTDSKLVYFETFPKTENILCHTRMAHHGFLSDCLDPYLNPFHSWRIFCSQMGPTWPWRSQTLASPSTFEKNGQSLEQAPWVRIHTTNWSDLPVFSSFTFSHSCQSAVTYHLGDESQWPKSQPGTVSKQMHWACKVKLNKQDTGAVSWRGQWRLPNW